MQARQISISQHYEERLQVFLTQLHSIEQQKRLELYSIMDMVPFRDLETALMMATMNMAEGRTRS
jgi:hypothetical protein